MSKIAIDVVLLPDQKMIDQAIKLNRALLKKYQNKIILGNVVNMPHISLCMGAVNEIELPDVIKSIDKISDHFTRMDFEGKPSIQHRKGHEDIVWLEIEKNDNIQNLQEMVMKNLWNYLSYDIEKYMFADPHEIEDTTVSYVKYYSSFYDNPALFKPHITLGVGSVTDHKKYRFSSSELAIFKLGNHCTCRELIYRTNLN
ncbi:MAG: hypothetical protein HKN90_03025 [Flavobacteriaceae bacterium]|nr:hypothetical protein [Flavobacteriaceae bacterium]